MIGYDRLHAERTWRFCGGSGGPGLRESRRGKAPAAAAGSPEFDQHWSTLAENEVDVFYIEDDRGEGLMGNVRRR